MLLQCHKAMVGLLLGSLLEERSSVRGSGASKPFLSCLRFLFLALILSCLGGKSRERGCGMGRAVRYQLEIIAV